MATFATRREPRSKARKNRPATSRNSRRGLFLEQLEDRALLAGFNFADFSDSSSLSLLGDASITADNRLRLTPAAGGQVGAAWYTAEKQFVGFEFSTTFQFQMADNFDAPGGSDGFTFIIQNSAPTYLSGGGGTLGYIGLPNSLVVEFDTFQNSEASDPSGSHISVHTNGTGVNDWSESLSLGSYSTNPIMDDANVHLARIDYTQGTLSIYLDDLTTPKLTIGVDLGDTLSLDAGRAWLGFTGATGGGYQTHDILNWNYDATIPPTIVSIDNASQIEGDSGTSDLVFTVTRAGDLSAAATIDWTTVDGSATASSGDYVAGPGQVAFAPNEAAQTITIAFNGDTAIETHETFSIQLSGATSGWILDSVGSGTILTDDVSVSINDASVIEGSTETAFLDAFVNRVPGGLQSPKNLLFHGGDLFVASANTNSVMKYDSTGSVVEFVSPQSGGLNSPYGLAFDSYGYLYVSSSATDEVLRYKPDGSFDMAYVTVGSGGLRTPRGIVFGPDGRLYVTSTNTDQILAYEGPDDPNPGSPGGEFADTGLGSTPLDMTFGPDGNLYVGSSFFGTTTPYDARIDRFDSAGVFIDTFIPSGLGGLSDNRQVLFDEQGNLYVADVFRNAILRYQGPNGPSPGAFIDEFVPAGLGGLSTPIGAVFGADGNMYVTSRNTNQVLRYGAASQAAFTISLSSASGVPVTVGFVTADGTAQAGSDYDFTGGTLTFAPGDTAKTIFVRTRNDAIIELDETFAVNLSAADATIQGGATGVIYDPATEFRVNTTTAGSQLTTILPINNNPLATQQAVAGDSAGNFVVAWSGNGNGDLDGVFFQRYDSSGSALGGETLVNVTTADAQTNPVVGRAASNGKYVIAWNSNSGVYGRVFNANGTAASSEITIAAGSTSTRNYVDSIAVDADGDFVVLYKQFVKKGISESRYWQVQRFNAAGQAQGSATRVTTLNLTNGQAGVASDSSGNFMVVWDDGSINAQRYNSSGKKVGSLINVNSSVPGGEVQWQCNVGRDADGDSVVTWVVRQRDAANHLTYEHYVQVLNKDGTKRGSPFIAQTTLLEMPASIAVHPGGDFILSWTDSDATTATNVYAQTFDLNGVPQEASRRVNLTASGSQERSSIAVVGDGDYVVAWNTSANSTFLDSDVRVRRSTAAAALMAAGGIGMDSHGEITSGPELQAAFAEPDHRWEATNLQLLAGTAVSSESAIESTIAKQDQSVASDAALLDMMDDWDQFGGARKKRR